MKPLGSCLKGFRRNVQMRSESLLGRVAAMYKMANTVAEFSKSYCRLLQDNII